MPHPRLSLILTLCFLFAASSSKAAVLCAGLKSVSAGEFHTLALSDDNNLWACGGNSYWQAGLGVSISSVSSLERVKGEDGVGFLKNIIAFDAGFYHSLAADVKGTIYAWGTDGYGLLGNGAGQHDSNVPHKVSGVDGNGYLSHIVYVSAGRSGVHSLAVDSNGYVYAWGGNGSGQCGDGTYAPKDTPALVLDDNSQTTGVYLGDIAHIIKVDAGVAHSIALDSNGGHVWHWGSGSSTVNYPEKVKASGGFGGQQLSNIISISTCDHSLAVDVNGCVWEWTSSNGAYKIHGGETGTLYLDNIAEVGAGYSKSMARTRDGRVLVWNTGQNAYPVYVTDGAMQTQSGLLEEIVSIAHGYYDFIFAVSADGRGWGWGINDLGQLGVGDTVNRAEPAQMDCAEISDSSGIIYVDEDATGGLNNGSSWDNAYLVFEDALYEAKLYVPDKGNCEIWIAAGTYKPPYQESDYSNATFQMPAGNIAIRGHFGGIGVYETSPDQRDFANPEYETYFDGRVGPSGQRANYVVTCDDIGAGLVLDGFTFTGASSAGLYISFYSHPSIVHCKFNDNGSYGILAEEYSYPDVADCQFLENGSNSAGIYSSHSWPYVKDCAFDGNNNNSYGLQGMYSDMIVENCVIRRQSINGMNFSNSSLTVIDCNIENNQQGLNFSNCPYVVVTDSVLQNNSYGIYSSGSNLEATNCRIQGNTESGIFSSASVATITNNDIYNNRHFGIYTDNCVNIDIKNNWIHHNGYGYITTDGSGLYFRYSNSPPLVRNNTIAVNAPYGIFVNFGMDPCLVNDIIRQNGINIYSVRGLEDVEVSYCCIEGGFPGTGNIDCDPCFFDSDVNNFRLKPVSLCIDAGDPCADYDGETDIDGEPRIADGRIDIGADEAYWPKADYNLDEIVNFNDFAQLFNDWQEPNSNKSLDGDTDVDINDLEIFCGDWLWTAAWSEKYGMLESQTGMSDMVVVAQIPEDFNEESIFWDSKELMADAVCQEPSESVEVPMSDEQIQELIDWTQEIWQSSPEIQNMLNPQDLQKIINSLEEQLND